MGSTKAGTLDAKDIPLPPQEIRDQMVTIDDGGEIKPDTRGAMDDRADIEALDFVEPSQFSTTVSLKHPFKRDGKTVRKVLIRRLKTGEVARLVNLAVEGAFSNYDAYAAMTGLPKPVVRGLIDEDGDAVTDACFDFLPPVLKGGETPRASGPT